MPVSPTETDLSTAEEWGRDRYPFIVKSNDCTTQGVGVYKVRNDTELRAALTVQWNTAGMLLQSPAKGKLIVGVNWESDLSSGAKGVSGMARFLNQKGRDPPNYDTDHSVSKFVQIEFSKHPKLCSMFDYYAKHLPGFYVGRFDVMTPNVDSFLKGQFSVIEVNGAMSEIWDETKCGSRIQWKGHRVFMGWRHMLLLRAQNPFEMVRVMFGAFRRANGCGLSEFQWCPSSSS